MLYPVGSSPVQLSSSEQQAALISNSGESTVYLYRNSAVTSNNYDMILPGGGAQLSWPAGSELWAVTEKGKTPTNVTLLFTAGAAFTPAPAKVQLVSGSSSVAANAVLLPNVPQIFNVSSSTSLYFDSKARYDFSIWRNGNNTSALNIGGGGTQNYRILLEWGVDTGTEFKIFSSSTMEWVINGWVSKGISRPGQTRKLTVSAPSLRLTLQNVNVAMTDATVNLIGVTDSATVATDSGTGWQFGSSFSVLDSRMVRDVEFVGWPLPGNRQMTMTSVNGTQVYMYLQFVGPTASPQGGGGGVTSQFTVTTPQFSNPEAIFTYDKPPNGGDVRITFQ